MVKVSSLSGGPRTKWRPLYFPGGLKSSGEAFSQTLGQGHGNPRGIHARQGDRSCGEKALAILGKDRSFKLETHSTQGNEPCLDP